MRLGLIGGGYWGKNLIREFYNLGVLDTVCDVDEKALLQYKELYPEVKVTKEWHTILESDEINSVCVSLPAEMHYRFAKEALLADKDVYVEKPITLSIDEAEELVHLAEERGKILMVGHLLHYHGCIIKVKEMIREGKLGKIHSITCNRLNLGKFRVNENVLWSFAPHDISVALSLCGDRLPAVVQSGGHGFVTDGLHDIVNSVLRYDDGPYVNINVSWLHPYKEQKLVVVGDKGMLCFDDVVKKNKLKYYTGHVEYNQGIPVAVKGTGVVVEYDLSESPLNRECQHFIECCNTRAKPITDGQEGLRVLKVLDHLQKSLESGGQLTVINNGYFSHPTATIDDGAYIGKGTRVWHYSHVCKGAEIGENCNIGQNVFIAGGSYLGSGCKVQNNVSVYKGVHCEDNVFLGPSCVLTNDINPRCEYPKHGEYMDTYIEEGATIGANATIVCGTRLGKYCLIGAGAVVTKNVEPYSIMVGNPAKRIGTIDEKGNRELFKNKPLKGGSQLQKIRYSNRH